MAGFGLPGADSIMTTLPVLPGAPRPGSDTWLTIMPVPRSSPDRIFYATGGRGVISGNAGAVGNGGYVEGWEGGYGFDGNPAYNAGCGGDCGRGNPRFGSPGGGSNGGNYWCGLGICLPAR